LGPPVLPSQDSPICVSSIGEQTKNEYIFLTTLGGPANLPAPLDRGLWAESTL